MSIARRLMARQTKPQETSPYRVAYLPAKQSGVLVTHDTALEYSPVWGCVRILSNTIMTLPWRVFMDLPEGGKKALPGHPVDWLLHYQANPEMTALKFRETMMGWALLWGNAYAEIERDNGGRAVALWPIAPDRVDPKRMPSGELFYEISNRRGATTILYPWEMYHLAGLGWDGLVGYSVIAMARQTVGLGMAGEDFGSAFYENGTNIGGVLEHPKKLSPEAQTRLKTQMEERHSGGPDKAGKIMFLEEGLKFTKTVMPPEDAQFLQTRKFQVAEVARWYGVPLHKLAELDKATFCLPADSQIYTEIGPKRIADVIVGEKVWSLGADRKMVLSPVIRSGCTGNDEILEIKTRARTLRCNAKHRVLVRRDIYELFEGRGQCIKIDGIRYRRSTETVWIPAGEIVEGDRLISPVYLPDHGTDQAPTRKATIPFMESLGFILGDGFFYRAHISKKGAGFGISHGKGAAYLPAYIAAIESSFRACDGPYAMKNGGTVALVSKRRDDNTTLFNSTLAYAELEKLGIVGTSKTKRVPSWVFGLTKELRLALIRGYLDSDGTVTKGGQARFVSVNRRMLEQFRHLCMGCGIRVGTITQSRIKSNFDGYGDYEHVLFAFVCSDPNEIGTHTPMYRERIDKNIAESRGRVVRMFPYEAKKCTRDETFYYQKVISISKKDAEPVYDLEVAGTHSFMADGVIVHNSNIEEQNIDFVQDGAFPWVKRLESEADSKLFGRQQRGRVFTKLNLNGILRGDSAKRATFYQTMWNIGVFSINDIRELEDLNPVAHGDEHFVELNRTTLEKAALEPVEPSDTPAETGEDEGDTQALTVKKAVLVATLEKFIKREANRASDNIARCHDDRDKFVKWMGKFFAQHRLYMIRDLLPVATDISAHLRVIVKPSDAVVSTIDRHIDNSRLEMLSIYDGAHKTYTLTASQMADRLIKDIVGA